MQVPIRWTLCFCVVSAIAGCGPSSGTVSGKVTVKNKPVSNGSIIFTSEKGSASARIKDGAYTAEKVLAGENKVSLSVPTNSGGDQGAKFAGKPAAAKPGMPKGIELPEGVDPKIFAGQGNFEKIDLPDEYLDPAKTPLTHKVTSGKTEFNIDIK